MAGKRTSVRPPALDIIDLAARMRPVLEATNTTVYDAVKGQWHVPSTAELAVFLTHALHDFDARPDGYSVSIVNRVHLTKHVYENAEGEAPDVSIDVRYEQNLGYLAN